VLPITVSEAIPVTGRGGLYGCDKVRIPQFLDNWFVDGGKVVSRTHRPHFYSTEASGTHFNYRLSQTLEPTAAGRVR
jgi:hypothetical protein